MLCLFTQSHAHAGTYALTRTHTHKHTHAHACAHTHTYAHAHTHTLTYIGPIYTNTEICVSYGFTPADNKPSLLMFICIFFWK